MREFLSAMLATQNVAIPDQSVPAFVASRLAAIVEGAWRLFEIKKEPPLLRFATDITARECTIRIDRARQELGYSPVVSVAQGLEALRASGLHNST